MVAEEDTREVDPALTRTNEGENDCDRRHGREGIQPRVDTHELG